MTGRIIYGIIDVAAAINIGIAAIIFDLWPLLLLSAAIGGYGAFILDRELIKRNTETENDLG